MLGNHGVLIDSLAIIHHHLVQSAHIREFRQRHTEMQHFNQQFHDGRFEGQSGRSQIGEQVGEDALEVLSGRICEAFGDVENEIQRQTVPIEAGRYGDLHIASPLNVLEGLHHERVAPGRLRVDVALIEESERAAAHGERAEVGGSASEASDHLRVLFVAIERKEGVVSVQTASLVEDYAQTRSGREHHTIVVTNARFAGVKRNDAIFGRRRGSTEFEKGRTRNGRRGSRGMKKIGITAMEMRHAGMRERDRRASPQSSSERREEIVSMGGRPHDLLEVFFQNAE